MREPFPGWQFGKPAQRHLFRGQMLTVKHISRLTGLKESTLYRRLREGRPLDGPLIIGVAKRLQFRGRIATVNEIMVETGFSRSTVHRHSDGVRFFEPHEIERLPREFNSNAHLITYAGITDHLKGWARRSGIPHSTLFARLVNGWPAARALTDPPLPSAQRRVFRHNRRIIQRIAASFHPREAAHVR